MLFLPFTNQNPRDENLFIGREFGRKKMVHLEKYIPLHREERIRPCHAHNDQHRELVGAVAAQRATVLLILFVPQMSKFINFRAIFNIFRT